MKILYTILLCKSERNFTTSSESTKITHVDYLWTPTRVFDVWKCGLITLILNSWIKRDQLDVTCFIPLFNAQHVSDVNTSILRSLRIIWCIITWVVMLWFVVCWCYVVVWLGRFVSVCRLKHYQHTSNQSNTTHVITDQISRKFLRMDVLTSETCWAWNNEIKVVTSSWSLFIQVSRWCTVQ